MLLNLQKYHRPTNVDQAVTLLRQGAPHTVTLAGGTKLMASGRRDVEAVVDLRDLPLSYVRAHKTTLHIGATTTLQKLADAPGLQHFSSGVLVETAGAVANRNIRNAATVGGTVASAGGENPLLTALLALDAELTVYASEPATPDESSRCIPLAGFLNYRERLLRNGALITEVRLPLLVGPLGAALASVARTPRDRPIVCVIARLELAEGIAANVRLALGGMATVPVRAREAEQLLERKALSDERMAEAAQLAAAGLNPPGDFRGSAAYRQEMARVLARRALSMARARAQA
jgi:probable selenate reductase FAD-binding subunit